MRKIMGILPLMPEAEQPISAKDTMTRPRYLRSAPAGYCSIRLIWEFLRREMRLWKKYGEWHLIIVQIKLCWAAADLTLAKSEYWIRISALLPLPMWFTTLLI